MDDRLVVISHNCSQRSVISERLIYFPVEREGGRWGIPMVFLSRQDHQVRIRQRRNSMKRNGVQRIVLTNFVDHTHGWWVMMMFGFLQPVKTEMSKSTFGFFSSIWEGESSRNELLGRKITIKGITRGRDSSSWFDLRIKMGNASEWRIISDENKSNPFCVEFFL